MAKTVTAKSKGHAKSEGHRRATHMHIRALENGVMASTDHEPPKQSKAAMKAGGMMGYEPSEDTAFTSRDELHRHIDEKFGHLLTADQAKDEKTAKAGGQKEKDNRGEEEGAEGNNGEDDDEETGD